MSDTYFVVGIHGAPTPETAPHGIRFRSSPTYEVWSLTRCYEGKWGDDVQWQPLPAPPTEQAPPPEPPKPWMVASITPSSPGYVKFLYYEGRVPSAPGQEAATALNALHRDGVAWGPGRPMEELPETGRVLVLMTAEHGRGIEFYAYNAEVVRSLPERVRCWWPLPGEAQ